MSRLNKYDEKQFRSATNELFDNIEFMVGNNYMIVSLDEEIGPRYFRACEDLGKKPSDVVQAFIEVKTPQYEQRVLNQEQMDEIEQRKAKFALLNPKDESKNLNRFDQKQLKKVSEEFLQNLEVMFGEKTLMVRLDGDLKERFYKACERLGKNPYSIVQELIASKVQQYEDRVKRKALEKERQERNERLDRFQQSISETKKMINSGETYSQVKTNNQKGTNIKLKDE